jgi:hypothetical protein
LDEKPAPPIKPKYAKPAVTEPDGRSTSSLGKWRQKKARAALDLRLNRFRVASTKVTAENEQTVQIEIPDRHQYV